MNTMKRIWAVCLLGSLTVAGASAATFTNNLLISETNFTYDGQDIVVDGATMISSFSRG